MNLDQAKEKVKEGNHVTNLAWGACKIIRSAQESDVEYINFPPEGLIVEDCEQKICDCKIAIFQPTEEDLKSTDYIIVA